MYERKLNMQCETKTNNRNLTVLRTLAVMLAIFFTFNYWQTAAALENPEEIQSSAQQPPGNQPNAERSPVDRPCTT